MASIAQSVSVSKSPSARGVRWRRLLHRAGDLYLTIQREKNPYMRSKMNERFCRMVQRLQETK